MNPFRPVLKVGGSLQKLGIQMAAITLHVFGHVFIQRPAL
jgi:hypothetical protein